MPESIKELPQGIQLGRILAGETHMDVVYFLAMTYQGREAVKIGTSTRLKKRISSVSYVAEMEDILLLMPGAHDVETSFHNRFREYQIKPYAELFWREGELSAFVAMAPPISFAAAFKARIRRNFTKNPRAKREPKYRPQPEPEVPAAPQPVPEPAPEPEPDLDTPMSLLNIVRAFILPHGTPVQQMKYTHRLRQDRWRSDRGELPGGATFPEPAEIAEDGRQTELFIPAQLIEFNAARRGARVVA